VNGDLRLETEAKNTANMVVVGWYEALRMKLDDPDTRKVFEYRGNEKSSNKIESQSRTRAVTWRPSDAWNTVGVDLDSEQRDLVARERAPGKLG